MEMETRNKLLLNHDVKNSNNRRFQRIGCVIDSRDVILDWVNACVNVRPTFGSRTMFRASSAIKCQLFSCWVSSGTSSILELLLVFRNVTTKHILYGRIKHWEMIPKSLMKSKWHYRSMQYFETHCLHPLQERLEGTDLNYNDYR